MKRGRGKERGDNGLVEVGELATTLSVCLHRMDRKGEEKLRMHKASRKIKRRAVEEDRY